MSLLQQLLRLRVQPAPDGEPSMLVRETAVMRTARDGWPEPGSVFFLGFPS